MKYLLVIASLFFITNIQAQKIDKLDAFGEAFFKHCKKREYKQAAGMLDTYFRIMKDNQVHRRSDSKKNLRSDWKSTDSIGGVYLQSLKDDYGIKGMTSIGSYVKTVFYKYPIKYSFLRKQEKLGIKIVFKDNEGQKYYFDPGYWMRTPQGQWTFYGHETTAYYYGKILESKMGLRLVSFPKDDHYEAELRTRNYKDSVYEADRAKSHEQYKIDLAAYKAKLKAGIKAKPIPKLEPTITFASVEQVAEFPGGEEQLSLYLSKCVKQVKNKNDKKQKRFIFISFVVENDGSVSHVKLAKGITSEKDIIDLDLVRRMPKWRYVARRNGIKCRSQYIVPIEYKLE